MSSIILASVLLAFAAKIFFAVTSLLCRVIDVLYMSFEVFAGIRTITYQGSKNYIINVFFENDVITYVFWGMACIGFALTFGFAIFAVVRKIFDVTGEKVKGSNAQILINCFKSILLILLMTAIVTATINATGTLMQAINKLFNVAESEATMSKIVFSNEDFACMSRIMDTIGNYAVNPSYDSRFNINSCFNAIRTDLQELNQVGTFRFSYAGAEDSWQYTFLQLYNTCDIYKDVDIDSYNVTLTRTLSDCMYRLKTDKSYLPLQSYSNNTSPGDLGAMLGKVIILSCTFDCAENSSYNKDPSLMDSLRYPYYCGDKDVYDYDTMDDDFKLGIFSFQYIAAIGVAIMVVKEMATILINCTGRIFNIMILYIVAPPFIAAMPLDDGGKFKQWTTAFVIQSLSIFGSMVAVRLLVIFIPIILSPQLVIFSGKYANALSKLMFIVGICFTSEKASSMISGILADNAGYQSIMAGDVGSGLVGKGMAIAGKAVMGAAKAGWKLGKGVLGAVGDLTGLTTAKDNFMKKTGLSKLKQLGQSARDRGGIVKAFKSGLTTNADDEAKKKAQDANQEKNQKGGLMDMLQDALSVMTDGKIPPSSQNAKQPPGGGEGEGDGGGDGDGEGGFDLKKMAKVAKNVFGDFLK